MSNNEILNLLKPPDFEVRADNFVKKLSFLSDKVTFMWAENWTKELPKTLERGFKALWELGINVEKGGFLKETVSEALRGVDIQSANENLVEVGIVDADRDFLIKVLEEVNGLAIEFEGERTSEPEIFENPDDPVGQYSTGIFFSFK